MLLIDHFNITDNHTIDSSKFYNNYYQKRRPTIIKGGAYKWPLINKWNKDYIIQVSGSELCTLVNDSRPAFSKEKSTLKSYFENMSVKSTLTLQKFDELSYPTFINDVPFPNLFFSKKDVYRYFFYHSRKNEGTLPHIHGDAFNILQSGIKHWIFYDAIKTKNMRGFNEMMNTFGKYPPGSHARDYFKNELKTFSNKNIQLYECIQNEGDIVYIPREYCHAVLNLSEVMGIVFETKLIRL